MRQALGVVMVLAACGGGSDVPLFPPGHDGGIPPDGPMADARPDAPMNPDGSVGPDGAGDGQAPVIELVKPAVGALISGTLDLEVNVTDNGTLMAVSASIAGSHEITMNPGAMNRFIGTFDTTVLAGLVAPTIVVRASDASGLETELGFVITLDNAPPFAELDPPRMRTTRINQGIIECSRDFDPVGDDAPDDGQTVPQLIELRGRVIDVGNSGTIDSTLAIPVAGIDHVDLYVFDDTTKPLVVDTDGDGICDDINPDIVPAAVPSLPNEAAVIALAPVDAAGAGFYTTDAFGGQNLFDCTAGDDQAQPAPVCQGEPTSTKIIKTVDAQPQIFGIPPVSTFNCMGFAFDARASNINDGFACAALLTVDKLGKRSVSPPLRICVDSNANGDNGCGAMGSIAPAGSRPDCTGKVVNNVVTPTPCTPRKFFRGVANEFELIPE